MAEKLGWLFEVDNFEGIPYFKCPKCGRKISGKKVKFADIPLNMCPDCSTALHMDNITEENMLYIDSYYGDDNV